MTTRSGVGPNADFFQDWKEKALSLERGWILTAAVVSVLFGVFVLVQPRAGLLTTAIFFGIYLVVAGVSRFSFAIVDAGKPPISRWLGGILGILIVVAGFICILNLATSLETLAFVLGVGLLIVGVVDLFTLGSDEAGRPTWLRVISGVLSILAGIAMFIVPFVSVGLIVVVGAISLIVVGIAGLVALPRFTSIDPRD